MIALVFNDMGDSPEDAEELKDMISEGKKFYVETYIIDDTEVVSIDEDVQSGMTTHDYNSENQWIFKAVTEKGDEWHIQVLPEASPNNGGILRLFPSNDGDIYGGHNEVYPRALNFMN